MRKAGGREMVQGDRTRDMTIGGGTSSCSEGVGWWTKQNKGEKLTNPINRTNEREPRHIPRRPNDLGSHYGIPDGDCIVVCCSVHAACAVAYAECFVDSVM